MDKDVLRSPDFVSDFVSRQIGNQKPFHWKIYFFRLVLIRKLLTLFRSHANTIAPIRGSVLRQKERREQARSTLIAKKKTGISATSLEVEGRVLFSIPIIIPTLAHGLEPSATGPESYHVTYIHIPVILLNARPLI
jgi:hypothetical protein